MPTKMKKTSFKEIKEKMIGADSYLIFSVGDSITEGQRATCADNTYTAVFAKLLCKKLPTKKVVRYDGKRHKHPESELMPIATYGEPITLNDGTDGCVTVVRSGIGGNTVRRLLNRKDDFVGKEIDGRLADLFIISVGINDSIQSNPAKYIAPEGYKKDLEELLCHIETYNKDADVIFMTPTWYDHGDSKQSVLDAYAEQMKLLAQERGIPVIDMHRMWLDHLTLGGENYGQGDWLVCDRCHPGDVGHAAMAEKMISCIFE